MSFDPRTGGPCYLADIRRGAPQQIAQVLRDHQQWKKPDVSTGTVGMDDQGLADSAAPDTDVLAVRPDCLGRTATEEIESYRLALAWIAGQSTDPKSRELATDALGCANTDDLREVSK